VANHRCSIGIWSIFDMVLWYLSINIIFLGLLQYWVGYSFQNWLHLLLWGFLALILHPLTDFMKFELSSFGTYYTKDHGLGLQVKTTCKCEIHEWDKTEKRLGRVKRQKARWLLLMKAEFKATQWRWACSINFPCKSKFGWFFRVIRRGTLRVVCRVGVSG